MYRVTAVTATIIAMASASFAQQAEEDKMRDLTSSVLAGITGAKPVEEDPAAAPEEGALEQIIEQALTEGQSDEYLDALLNEAADEGTIAVPDSMRTTEGRVDTRTLIASLVDRSLEEEVESDTAAALEAEADGEPAEDQYYVVAAGDSLAAIALSFYDDPQAYTRIFEANRTVIERPNLIGVGQRLLIPR